LDNSVKRLLGFGIKLTDRKLPRSRLVYSFTNKKTEGNEKQKYLLGGKGANLHGMSKLGLPVPPGFTVSTDVCTYYYEHGKSYPKSLAKQVASGIQKIEKSLGKSFGDPENPLLVSVRSGAPVSMPGMMDTILNLGLNDSVVKGLEKASGDARFALDSYRRLIAMYSDVVLGISSNFFEGVLDDLKNDKGVSEDTELDSDDLRFLIDEFKRIVRSNGKEFPEDPWEQLWGAVGAVFGSWMNPRAITYRKLNQIPDKWGTAVNVQAMVFGNLGSDCATGVAFTRDPSDGRKKFFGEYLVNAQGEDVVAGIRTPLPINKDSITGENLGYKTLKELMPKPYAELDRLQRKLEKHYRDMQDIEFTIERGKLFMLQTRTGKRTAAAALKITVDMVGEKLIKKNEAIMRIDANQLDRLLHPMLDPGAAKTIIAKGLPASPGAASGQVVFDSETAEKWAGEMNRKVILVRVETSPEDIGGMAAAEGILTARGGMTSHAAVVARGMGKCCVAGCSALRVSNDLKEFTVGGKTYKEGDFITLEGSSGEVIDGKIPTVKPTLNKDFSTFMKWVDEVKLLGVRTNADNPADSKAAREFGAEGIGLCRTEHMFFEVERINWVRQMILADNEESRADALEKILPMQREDFKGIFKEMAGLPVTIRLLDPPLHEFLPHDDQEIRNLADSLGVSYERLKRRAESLKEFNPMLGHRGCRLGISHPEIYKTQVRAIIEAACELYAETGIVTEPEIMIPLVGEVKELAYVEGYCRKVADRIMVEWKLKVKGLKIRYKIGTMIELPRAALTAGNIAKHAEFFSFGTNDLTQTTYGLSRDDSGMFLKDYIDAKIYERDPFATLDTVGVGELIKIAMERGRKTRKDIKLGICGEHGGDPTSIEFCHNIGLNYVSCSPYRVPIARLAAAHSQLKNPKKKTADKKSLSKK